MTLTIRSQYIKSDSLLAFQGKQRLMPFFNRQNNEDLLLAIQTAGVSRWRNGFRKDIVEG